MKHITCEDCGEPVYNGYCFNCDEIRFIAEQYYEDGESLPQSLADEVEELEFKRSRRV